MADTTSTTPAVHEPTHPPVPARASEPKYVHHGEGHHSHKHAHGEHGHHRHRHHHAGGDQAHTHDVKDVIHGDNPDHLVTHHHPHEAKK